jgi:alkylated DNA repair dioxygenase AlkB
MELLTIKPELDILSIKEESELLDKLLSEHGVKSNSRTLLRYGNSVYGNTKLDPIPEYLLELINKLINKKVLDSFPEDVTINTYYPGDSIPAHIDKIDAGPVITILSLLSEAKLTLTYGLKKEIITLPSRSIIQLKGVYRTHWKHSIEKLKQKRISIVFRQTGK